jgi:predicted Rossmann fold flavoprotein
VVATGGLSFKALGASPFGFELARQFNLKVEETSPALVGLHLRRPFNLAGVSLPCRIKISGQVIEDDLLFTHKGLSGPAILKASLYWAEGEEFEINFAPSRNWEELAKGQKSLKKIQSIFSKSMQSVWHQRFYSELHDDFSNFTKEQKEWVKSTIFEWKVKPVGSDGYRRAEVTRGGVSTDELSSKTMESKKVESLYFIGEVVDVTGTLGGFNFQWAWSSGQAAAQAIIQKFS